MIKAYDVAFVRERQGYGLSNRTSYVIGQDGKIDLRIRTLDWREHVEQTLAKAGAARSSAPDRAGCGSRATFTIAQPYAKRAAKLAETEIMRAEGQAHIDRIEAALALVRRSLDWDRALRRLDELNARVEDPEAVGQSQGGRRR